MVTSGLRRSFVLGLAFAACLFVVGCPSGTQVTVPNLVGLSQSAAQNALSDAGLGTGAVTQQSSSTVPAGSVISQNPSAGVQVAPGTSVDFVVSSGQGNVSVPNVVGSTQSAAGSSIVSAGLTIGTVTQQFSAGVAAGIVISQNPAAGASVTPGTSVSLVVSKGPQQVSVPNVVGMNPVAAGSALTGIGLSVGSLTEQFSATVPSGLIISQNPVAGASVPAGTAVNIVVSRDPEAVIVPNVVGMTQANAESAITTAGLPVGTVTQQFSTTVPAGQVISQDPIAGSSVVLGSTVALVVSKGPQTVSVPNVVGMTQSEAETAIMEAGLLVGTGAEEYSETVPAGQVISQNPTAGSSAASGTLVNLIVSKGPQPVNVPNVVGMTQANAESAITAEGLTVGNVTQQISETVPAGNVISQNPTAGNAVSPGTAVNLVVSSGPQMFNASDYFPTTPGHGVRYHVTDTSNNYEDYYWAVMQTENLSGTPRFTMTFNGNEVDTDNNLGGSVSTSGGRDILSIYRGSPSVGRGFLWFNLGIPTQFTSNDSFTFGGRSATVTKLTVPQTINGTTFTDCIRIDVDASTVNDPPYTYFLKGTGQFILARGVGVVKLDFQRTADQSRALFEYMEAQEFSLNTISGTVTIDGVPAVTKIVQISYDAWNIRAVTDVQGRFSLQAYGPTLILRIGDDADQDDLLDVLNGYPLNWRLAEISGDIDVTISFTSPAETFAASDYFPTTPGHGVRYHVTDSWGNYNDYYWAVIQTGTPTESPQFTMTFNGDKNNTDNSLRGRVSTVDGKQLYTIYAGYPVRSQGFFWWNFGIPFEFTSNDTYSFRGAIATIIKLDDPQTYGGQTFSDCVRIDIDATNIKNSTYSDYHAGLGYIVLARNVGVVKLEFVRATNQTVVSYEYIDSQVFSRKTISGTITIDGVPAVAKIVQIHNAAWEIRAVTDAAGRFSLQAYGPTLILRIGDDADQNNVLDFVNGWPKTWKLSDVSGDTEVDVALTSPPQVLSVTPVQREMSSSSRSTSFAVSNPGGGTLTWTAAVTSGTWVNITSGSSGTNDGTIELSYGANPSNEARFATLNVVAPGVASSPVALTVIQQPSTYAEQTIMLPGDVPLVMVWVPAGTYMMGAYPGEQGSDPIDQPQHQVSLTQGYWIGKYEVTQAQWTAVVGSNPSGFIGDDRPVERISWDLAQTFISSLNATTGRTFRLPTEAEWEYACRAGTATRYYWGDDPSYIELPNYAWNSNSSGGMTHNVGQRLPNPWALYDMSGNVWEWCQDVYEAYPNESVINPVGALSGSEYIRRGGGYGSNIYYCRSAARAKDLPSRTQPSFGFRLVVSLPIVNSFTINNGDSSTPNQTVTLNTTCIGSPSHYMASELPTFNDALWQPYSSSPEFTLSPGVGTKTVYFKVKNVEGVSAPVADSIALGTTATEETILLPGDIPLEMMWIPAGTFMMGRYPGEQDSWSEESPQHAVTVPGFWMGKYEVTQAQWLAVMGSNPSYFTGDHQRPVELVSWNDAQTFISALNVATGKTFRLPSEAEWEYACRAGTTTRFYWGDDPNYTQIGAYCWHKGNSNAMTHAVGAKLPNAWGLYDMSGNVWEYCEDYWHESYIGAPENGEAWVDSGMDRVLRGGNLVFGAGGCRSADRGGSTSTRNYIGIRISRSVAP